MKTPGVYALDAHLKKANQFGVRYMAILGSDEAAKGAVAFKDLNARKQENILKKDFLFKFEEEFGLASFELELQNKLRDISRKILNTLSQVPTAPLLVRSNSEFSIIYLNKKDENVLVVEDEYVLASDLGNFLQKQVAQKTFQRQTPQYGPVAGVGHEDGDYIFEINQ